MFINAAAFRLWEHQHALELYTLLDRAAVGYAQRLEVQCEAGCSYRTAIFSSRCRFTCKQKYLTEKFQIGEQSGRKSDPESVACSRKGNKSSVVKSF